MVKLGVGCRLHGLCYQFPTHFQEATDPGPCALRLLRHWSLASDHGIPSQPSSPATWIGKRCVTSKESSQVWPGAHHGARSHTERGTVSRATRLQELKAAGPGASGVGGRKQLPRGSGVSWTPARLLGTHRLGFYLGPCRRKCQF